MSAGAANAPSPARGIATRVEALGYRSLRHVDQHLGAFHVLVGKNASGKSTFLDVLSFVSDLVKVGASAAIEGDARLGIQHRAPDGKQLTWLRAGRRVELAVEFGVPAERLERLKNGKERVCRYEVALDVGAELQLVVENLWLKPPEPVSQRPRSLFPNIEAAPEHIVRLPGQHAREGWKKIIARGKEPTSVTFSSEAGNWNSPFRIAQDKTRSRACPRTRTSSRSPPGYAKRSRPACSASHCRRRAFADRARRVELVSSFPTGRTCRWS